MAGVGTAYPADYSATYSGPLYTAQQGRTMFAAAMAGATAARPLGGISGVRPGTPLTIATATSTTWTVTPFGGYIDLATSASNGGYFFSFLTNSTGTVTAAAGSARVDLLYVQLADVNTGDGTTVAPRVILDYQVGVAGAGIPALTAPRAFVIAQINVPASGGGSPTVTWVSSYTVAAGAPLYFLDRPSLLLVSGGYTGQLAVTRSDGQIYEWFGGLWVPVGIPNAASDAARNTLFSAPAVGNRVYRTDKGYDQIYNGTAWVGYGAGLVSIKPAAATGTGVTLGANGVVSLSASPGVSFDGAFTADFENYVAVIKVATTVSATLALLMRVAGVPITTGNYYGEIFSATGGTPSSGPIGPAATSGVISYPAGTIHVGEARFVGPLVGFAGGSWVNTDLSSISGTSVSVQKISNFINTGLPDGFSITPSAGTMTGTIRLYGYNNN